MTARPRRGALLSAGLLAAVVALVALQATWPRPGEGAPGPPGGAPRAPGRRRRATGRRPGLGVTTLAFARNSRGPLAPADLRRSTPSSARARRRTDLVMWFADWAHVRDFDARQAAAVAARGAARDLLGAVGLGVGAAGPAALPPAAHHRGRLRRLHRALGPRGRRLRAAGPAPLRPGDERPLVPWAERANGNRRGEFVRRLAPRPRDLRPRRRPERPLGVVPGGRVDPASQYPGRTQVDVLGLAGFNGGTAVFRRRWRSFRVAFGPSLDFLHGLARHKPIELSEVGSVGAGRQQGGLDPRHVPRAAAAPGGPLRRVVQRPQGGRLADRELRSAQRAFAAEVSRAELTRSRKAKNAGFGL